MLLPSNESFQLLPRLPQFCVSTTLQRETQRGSGSDERNSKRSKSLRTQPRSQRKPGIHWENERNSQVSSTLKLLQPCRGTSRPLSPNSNGNLCWQQGLAEDRDTRLSSLEDLYLSKSPNTLQSLLSSASPATPSQTWEG